MTGLRTEISRRQAGEVLAAVAVLLWRIYALRGSGLWRDWLALLSIYWIFSVFFTGKRSWSPVTVAFVAVLMALYLWGQMPEMVKGLSGLI